ncbi:DNA-binding transcriptional ArsR family regulator [Microbacterium resistens]|uniref:DNA-binding transcriptional ArsR family regulator n=1 Tax=Microbacterium resistens TaxID=156977 RepID=A0ABU1S8U7_9MICO|nr:winged helix-turn-helix domain-containing protein [Microbacterium resistens]MDR6866042.1 DNA-binding transcriptional ArsR family regulator [Microbacterium resistens]
MSIDPHSVAQLGSAIGNPARVAMCLAMLDGRAWTAGELARVAGVAKSTASEHLTALLEADLVTIRKQRRHAYVCLASPEAAHLIEAAASYAGTPAPVNSMRTATARDDLAAARTCYDHLAGALGVALFDALVDRDLLSVDDGLTVTAEGRSFFAELGGPGALVSPTRRPLVKTCLDWTERRSHLAGHLGGALLRTFVDRAWVAPRSTPRALTVTAAGLDALRTIFGVETDVWPPHRLDEHGGNAVGAR